MDAKIEMEQVVAAPVDMGSFLEDLLEEISQEEAKEVGIDFSEINIETAEGFSIKDERQANYFIGKVKEIREQREAYARQAQDALDSYTAKVQKFLDRTVGPLDRQEEFFMAALEQFALTERQTNPKLKTFKYIEGTLSFKSQQNEYIYDDKRLLEYLEKHSELDKYIRRKLEPNKSELKKAAEVKDGRLFINDNPIDGVTVSPRDEKFEVK